MSNQSKSINQKFDEQIDAYLDRLKEEMNPENESDLNDDLTRTSEVTRDTLDGDGNVTSSVVERHDEMTNHNLESLKSLVAVRNDYNEQKKSLIETVVKAGVSLAGIIILLGFEANHTISSRSLGFLPKPKI